MKYVLLFYKYKVYKVCFYKLYKVSVQKNYNTKYARIG